MHYKSRSPPGRTEDLRAPPIGLTLYVPQNNILDSSRHSRNLPRNVCLPTPPSFGQMLQNCFGLVLLDGLRHHVQNIVHYGCTELEIIVRLYALLRYSFRDTLTVATFKLTSKKIPEPTFKEGDNTTHKEEPDSPTRCPEAASGAFANRACVEAIVDQVLQVLGHAYLSHQLTRHISQRKYPDVMTTGLILVTVHPREGTDMSEDVLQSIGKLESINVAKPKLNMRINDELGEPQDFTTQMESIPEPRLLALFSCECLDRLQVHVIIKVKIVQVL